MSKVNIGKKIVKYQVRKKDEVAAQDKGPVRAEAKARKDGKVVWMHEKLERPDVLIGSTYKIKTPVSDHAMYVTINDIILNEGTEH
ncbi:MAG: NrdJb, partial [Steroidobacteraceae bacterium]